MTRIISAEFKPANSLLDDPAALRERFERDGYVYLKRFLAPGKLREVRDAITDVLARHGWIRPGAERLSAIPSIVPVVEGEEAYLNAYDDVQRLEVFHGLPHDPDLLRVMQILLDDKGAFPHPLSIARLVFPEIPEWATPPHQDFPNNQGTERLFASWIPVGDCPLELGPLCLLEGSHRLGRLDLAYSLGAGHRQAVLPPGAERLRWLSGEMALGDVLVFHSLMVHAALPNVSDRMRLSVDYRYQAEGDALTPRCLEPHFQRLSWDEIYRGWRSHEVRYYWRRKRYRMVEWDPSLHDLPDDHLGVAIEAEAAFECTRARLQSKYHGNSTSS